MASSHVAGRQKRAISRYTLFVVWELLRCRYRGDHKQSVFAAHAPFLFAIFPYETCNAEALERSAFSREV